MKIDIPNDVNYILSEIAKNNGESFIVGGCVRDSLLGRIPKDWDVCTNLDLDILKQIFPNTIPTGEKHGTLTVIINKTGYEVTRYRIDGQYTDGRHPDNVQFTTSLTDDLSRRDFTCNSMAYHPDIGLIDPFDGYSDLQNKIIKCVGNPIERFSEDYLRIVRAYRFAITYDFKIDEEIFEIGKKLLRQNKLKDLSSERLQTELFKMLSAKKFTHKSSKLLLHIFEEYKYRYFPEFERSALSWSQRHPNYCHFYLILNDLDFKQRVVALLFDEMVKCFPCINHKYDLSFALKLIKQLKCSNEIFDYVKNTLEVSQINLYIDIVELKQYIRKYGFSTIRDMLEIRYSNAKHDFYTSEYKISIKSILSVLSFIEEENQTVYLNQLTINGDDLINTLNIKQGKEIGLILEFVLDAVIHEKVKNDKEDLINYIKDNYLKEEKYDN